MTKRWNSRWCVLLAVAMLASGCFRLQRSDGGGDTVFEAPRKFSTSDIAVPPGYAVDLVAIGLDYPTDVAFDDQGRLYAVEGGYSYGDEDGDPRLVRVDSLRALTPVAVGEGGPWTGVDYHDGAFFIAGGHEQAGRVLRVEPDGTMRELVSDLPAFGDHHPNGPAVHDGWVYFGVGTATNSAVVGPDNFDFGWVQKHPTFHDVPCKDVELTPQTFESPNPATPDPDDRAITGAYQPFGSADHSGGKVPGQLPCAGAIMRVRTDGAGLMLYAWGFRNPFGLAFDPQGRLFATENQADVRGSRPVFGVGDLLWKVEEGKWYGWPDYYAGEPLTNARFAPPGGEAPGFVLSSHPQKPPHPAARLAVHSSSNGLDFSTNEAFGHVGEAFVAQFGDMAPNVGKVLEPVGFKVVRVDTSSGVVHEFAVNRGKTNGPASWLGTGGFERPVSAVFDPDGTALYVVDFGVMTIEDGKPMPQRRTGAIWKIHKGVER